MRSLRSSRPYRGALGLLVLAAALSPALAEPTHEAYEEALPSIGQVAARAHPEHAEHAAWQTAHAVSLEFTSMLLGLYPHHELVLKMRNLEPVLWAAQLAHAEHGGPLPGAAALHVLNVSHSGTLNDPNLPAYVQSRGISSASLAAGRRFLFVDGTYYQGDTYQKFLRAAFPDRPAAATEVPVRVLSNTGPHADPPHSWTSLAAASPGFLSAAGGDDAAFGPLLDGARMHLGGTWEFSHVIPHPTGNSDHYEPRRGGPWVAMSRRDRQVWSADQKPRNGVEGERERARFFVEDLKAYFTQPEMRQKMADRVAMWSALRTHAEANDAHALADTLSAAHARDPAHGEAVARDLADFLRLGHAGPHALKLPAELHDTHKAAPLAPRLIQHLRGR